MDTYDRSIPPSPTFMRAGLDCPTNMEDPHVPELPENLGVDLSNIDRINNYIGRLQLDSQIHDWVLGAFAELLDNFVPPLDNSVPEVCKATCVKIDVIENNKDGSRMILIEDDGCGMSPSVLQSRMSLDPSTVGQDDGGLKRSARRLGTDVIVFSCCRGENSPTRSVGMLSTTFLINEGWQQNTIVPMLDYKKVDDTWKRMTPSDDRSINLQTMTRWSPFSSEEQLLDQFNFLKNQGTRMIIYNLREHELDFENEQDIQVRTAGNVLHFFTSLRSYISILYRKFPLNFEVELRGTPIEPYNTLSNMEDKKSFVRKLHRDPNVVKPILGFAKDPNVVGVNVYHKNRLIKPFWRIDDDAGNEERGILGVLEADFLEPAPGKQGFNQTTLLSKLEAKIPSIQKEYRYWAKQLKERKVGSG